MVNYHVNGEGNPGVCRARKTCPFGDLSNDHFPTAGEAQKHYEKLATPTYNVSFTSEQLSALRRNGDFPLKEGDEELMNRLEREEDNRSSGNRRRENFSILEIERIAAIADYKITMLSGETGERLDRYQRGVSDRLISIRTKASAQAKARRALL